MSGYQPDAQAGQSNAEAWQYNWEGPPPFRVVRCGYDRE
jgi:hypothetical protein